MEDNSGKFPKFERNCFAQMFCKYTERQLTRLQEAKVKIKIRYGQFNLYKDAPYRTNKLDETKGSQITF